MKGKPPSKIGKSSGKKATAKTTGSKVTSSTRSTRSNAGKARATAAKASKARAVKAPTKVTAKTKAGAPKGKSKVAGSKRKLALKHSKRKANDDDMDTDSTNGDLESDSDQLTEIDMEDMESLDGVDADQMELDTGPNGKATFLDFPSHVRNRIYQLAGIQRDCPIDLAGESSRHEQIRIWKDVKPKPKRRSRYNYYDDRFDRCSDSYRGPSEEWPEEKPLCFCSALPVQLLTVSKPINEEVTHLLYGHNAIRISRDTKRALEVVKSLGTKALSNIHRLELVLGRISNAQFRTKHFPVQLNQIFDRVMKSGEPSKIDLLVTCDILGLRPQTISEFSQIFHTLSGFKNCAAKLAPYRDSRNADKLRDVRELPKRLARKVAPDRRLSKDPFPFFRLPVELRHQVLCQTELIFSREGSTGGNVEVVAGIKATNRRLSCCGKCTATGEICVCNTKFMSMSTTCTCNQSSMELFLVNSFINQEARLIFLTQNRFIFSGSMKKNLDFLRAQGPSFLQGLRRVDIDWQSMASGIMLGNPEHMHWQPMVDLLLKHTKLHVLELCMRFQSRGSWYGYPWTGSYKYTQEDYAEVIRPLKALRKAGLHIFKVFVQQEGIKEGPLERFIMGKEYKTEPFGKLDKKIRSPTDPHELAKGAVPSET